jgi:hypothetical protein
MTATLAAIRVALDTLRLNPLRTSLSTLGIIMGAASLAAVLSLADGGERLARQRIQREGLDMVQLRPQTEQRVDGIQVALDDYPLFDETDATAWRRRSNPRRACCSWPTAPAASTGRASVRACAASSGGSWSTPPIPGCRPSPKAAC